MTDILSAEAIRKTQDSLGKFVKKPPLTEKLLKKPPFKFLHDIINVVIRDTSFLEGLYTPDELQAENIKDREAKMKFLQKLIDAIKITTKQDINVKTSKIVAGLEPEKTNQLLQAIGMALENKLDSKEAVQRIKKGPIAKKPTAKTEIKPRDSSKPPPVKITSTNKDKEAKENKDIKESKPKARTEVTDKKPVSQRSLDKAVKGNDVKPLMKRTDSKGKIDSKDKKPSKEIKKVPSKEIIDTKVFGETVEKINGLSNGVHVESPKKSPTKSPAKSPKKSPAKILKSQKSQEMEDEKIELKEPEVITNGDHKNNNDVNGHEYETEAVPIKPQDELAAIIDEEAEYRKKEKLNKKLLRQKTIEDVHEKAPEIIVEPEKVDRFQSSYKREPIEDKSSRPRTSLRPPSARPASARPAAPRRRDKNVEIVLQPEEILKMGDINVKMESFSKELEDDGENLVIIEDPTIAADNILVSRMMGNENVGQDVNENDEHGHLVKQILETQKEFSGALGMTQENLYPKKTEIEFDESSAKQVEVLKDLIQKLTRSVNPMGKLMDFIQEDIDSMQREYSKWYEINKTATIEIRKEQSITANAVEPLKNQLLQLETSIKEHKEIVDTMRSTILQNEQKIFKIFTDV